MHLKFVLIVLVLVTIIPMIYFIMYEDNPPKNIVVNNSENLNELSVLQNQLRLSAFTSNEIFPSVLDEDNVLGFGYMWFIESSHNTTVEGILTNIHSQDGHILDDWHNELVITNYDQSNSFCIVSQKTIGDVSITNDTITANIPLGEINGDISEKYFTVKMISDTRCHSGIMGVILETL